MWRNNEFRLYLMISIIILLVFSSLFILLPSYQLFILLASNGILIVLFSLFTFLRYRNITKLSSYLRQIQQGNYTLDLRDNKEGELSYLKSELYKVTLKLTEQANQLRKDKKYLAATLADISHQLKTPLTSMMVMVDLLDNKELPEKKREEFLNSLQNQLKRINWLISCLLKMSKLDAGSIQLKNETISINKLIQIAVAPLLIPIELKEQTLIIEDTKNVSLHVDISWTAEALTNIIKNCMEHTPAKGNLSISCQKNALYTSIIIKDNGEGISKEDLPHIFKRFYRGSNSHPDSVGIGLALAKQIIQYQNGKIEVESHPDSGTTFLIKFYR